MTWAGQYARRDDFSALDERDIETCKNDPNSTYVFFDDSDHEAFLIINIFKSTDFEYNPMSGKPSKFNYEMLKDNIKWKGLKPKHYTNLFTAMIREYIRHLN